MSAGEKPSEGGGVELLMLYGSTKKGLRKEV